MKQLKDGTKDLHIVNDKLGTPTYTHDFAVNIKLLIEKGVHDLFNMVCGGLTSRLEVATELVKIFGLQSDVKVKEVNSKYFAKEYFAGRPDNERLINKHLDSIGLNKMQNWKKALRIYIQDYYSNYI